MLIPLFRLRVRLSIAYHPKKNRQIEEINQNLEQYIQHYVNNV